MDIYDISSLLFLKTVTRRTMTLCVLLFLKCVVVLFVFVVCLVWCNNTLKISLGKYPYRWSGTKIKQADTGDLNKTPCHRVSWEWQCCASSASQEHLIFLFNFPFDYWRSSQRFRPWKVFRPGSIKPTGEITAVSHNTYSAHPVHAIGNFLEVNQFTLRPWPNARFPCLSAHPVGFSCWATVFCSLVLAGFVRQVLTCRK